MRIRTRSQLKWPAPLKARGVVWAAWILGLILLAGCTGLAYSPEAAAVQEIANNTMREFAVDPATIQVLQKVETGQYTLVMTGFSGTRAGIGREDCLFLNEARKNLLGTWTIGSGGGGCSNEKPDPNTKPISVGGNTSSGSGRDEPGFSAVSGLVYREDIKTIAVTWDDGTKQQVDVLNKAYLAAREGQFHLQTVEAIKETGEVVYSYTPEVAPGKQ